MSQPASKRTRVRQRASRGRYDIETLHAVLDEGWIGHLGIVDPQAGPVVIPTTYVRVGEQVYLHGSRAARLLTLSDGQPACLTVTLLDGLVLARSGFNHSMNYRSAMIFGTAHAVTEPERIRAVLDALVDRFAPGRAAQLRPPTPKELAATALVSLALDEASVKVRSGGPVDDTADLEAPLWAGVVPLTTTAGAPQQDADTNPACPTPAVSWVRSTPPQGNEA